MLQLQQRSQNEQRPIYRQGNTFPAFIVLLIYLCQFGVVAAWCWDPVTLSCAGYPATVDAYHVRIAHLDPTPYPCQVWTCGPECDPLEPGCCVDVAGWCLAYTLSAWSDAATVPAPATCTTGDPVPTPGIGGVVWVNVVAENSNGRGPMVACP